MHFIELHAKFFTDEEMELPEDMRPKYGKGGEWSTVTLQVELIESINPTPEGESRIVMSSGFEWMIKESKEELQAKIELICQATIY